MNALELHSPWPTRQTGYTCATLLATVLAYKELTRYAPALREAGYQHAGAILAVQHALGLPREAAIQAWLLGHGLGEALWYTYCNLNVTVLLATILALAVIRPLLATAVLRVGVPGTMAALALFRLWPSAPPRFAEPGVLDLTGVPDSEQFWSHYAGLGFNPYAACPSLHVFWAALVGGALWLAAGRSPLRYLGLLWPLVMAAAVVGTGNHYLLDCLAGILLLVLIVLPGRRWICIA